MATTAARWRTSSRTLRKARPFAQLDTFLAEAPTDTPHDLFRAQAARASQTKERFSLNEVAITERRNIAVDMAQFVIPTVSRNTKRHETLQDFMLTNDLATVAVEVPVYLTHKTPSTSRRSSALSSRLPSREAPRSQATSTSCRLRNGSIYILDYKPGAKKDKPIEQLMVYALALASRTGLRLMDFTCAWFDDAHYYEFHPLHVVHKRRPTR